jgi:hypothetical protein
VNPGIGFASVADDSGRKQLVPLFTNRKDVSCGYPSGQQNARRDSYTPTIKRKIADYLLSVGAGLGEIGGASMTPGRATASIAIFQFPFSRFRILNQLPWMVLSLTVTE